MTLTSPNCPVAESLPKEVEDKVKSIDEVKDAEVEITFDPPWTPEMMTNQAREKLGYDPIKTKELDQKINVEWE